MCNVVVPEIIKRQCGGYLAVSPPYAALKIGVTAETKREAWFLFRDRYRVWRRLLREARKEKQTARARTAQESQ